MRTLRLFTTILALILVAGCASKPAKFYVLNPVASYSSGKNVQIKYHIGIMKVQLAEYLRRPQIVTRASNNSLFLDDFSRWAEPLQKNIQQSIKTSIEHLLPFATVTNYPWKASKKMNLTININIPKFDSNYQGHCVLQASYAIHNKTGKVFYSVRNKKFSTHVNPKSYNSIVAGMNKNLNRLSLDIISNIKKYMR